MLPLGGCISGKVAETSGVVDDRPAVMFNFEPGPAPREPVKVYINELYMGDAQDYQAGRTGMKIISGTHKLRPERAGEVILEQTFYAGAGATRTINVHSDK